MLKLAVLSFLFMCAYAAYYEDIAASTILMQNNDAQASWTAGYNTYLRGKSEAQVRRLMGAKMEAKPEHKDAPVVNTVQDNLPTAFTAGKDKWTTCAPVINYIKDQADCGSCWAVAASEVVEDRICIANAPSAVAEGKNAVGLNEPAPPMAFAAEDILSCCGSMCGDGCGGGFPYDAMLYWKNTGVVTGGWYGSNCGCYPYGVPPCGPKGCSGPEAKTPKCTKSCRSGYALSYTADKHHATNAYKVGANAAAIQTEIYNNGPVECAFNVYENFMSYKSGVYDKTQGSLLGGHAVKIMGWGHDTTSGKDYWLINNSWNTTWGMNGQFWFLRGTDLAGMESGCVAGTGKAGDTNVNLQC